MSEETGSSSNDAAEPEHVSRVSWRTLRRLTKHQWLYLPRLFSTRERVLIGSIALIAVAAFIAGVSRIVVRFTVSRPAVGGVLREGVLRQPQFINPIYASNDTDRDITDLVFSKLVRYDQNGDVVYDLARNVDVSSDGKFYTVNLREGVTWHDGKKFSADDVIFTIKTIQDPDYKSPLRQNWQGVSVEKLGDLSVRITLRQPYAPFLENLSIGILPAHLWQNISPDVAVLSDLNRRPIGTGPYRFSQFTQLDTGLVTSVSLVRNSSYHLEGPYIQEIDFSFYPTEDQLIAAYRRNEIDSFMLISQGPPDELKRLDLTVSQIQSPKIIAAFLNSTASPALGRKAVRQALAAAVNRDEILSRTVATGGALVNSALPPGTFGFASDIPSIQFDAEQAKRLLASDGWKLNSKDGLLERTEGSGSKKKTVKLQLTIATSDVPGLSAAANLIAGYWNAIGVKASVAIFPIHDLETAMIKPRAYDVLLFGELFGHDPDPFAFWHTSQMKDPGLNIALYSNHAVDQLLEEARRTNDAVVREAKYRSFQKLVSSDVGAIFLYSPAESYVIRNTVKGVRIGAITTSDERFDGVNAWYENTRRAFK